MQRPKSRDKECRSTSTDDASIKRVFAECSHRFLSCALEENVTNEFAASEMFPLSNAAVVAASFRKTCSTGPVRSLVEAKTFSRKAGVSLVPNTRVNSVY